jgi:hypothetical protein
MEELKKGSFHLGTKRRRVHEFFCNLNFSFEEGILVTLNPKTTSFWIFHPF